MRFSLITLFLLSACQKQPSIDENDPLLRKLQAEQARLVQTRGPSEAEALAKAATADEAPTVLAAPSTGQMHFGDVLFKVKSLERSHTVKGEKLSLTTADAFLKLTLTGDANKPAQFDLSGTTLELDSNVYRIDATAQRVGHGSPLAVQVGTEPTDYVLFFELPASSVRAGLKLVLRSADATSELALQ